jgi:hypothetical protein
VAGGFLANTRRRFLPLEQRSVSSGGGDILIWNLPKSGILSAIYLIAPITVTGTLSSPNPLGGAAIIRRMRVTVNTGVDLFNVTGPGYHYYLAYLHNEYGPGLVSPNAQNPIASNTTYQLNTKIPVAVNNRDPIGLVLLQSEQIAVQLIVEIEAASAVATGASLSGSIQPYLETFTVPVDAADLPPLNIVHQVLEETQVITATGEFTYYWPRGGQYLSMGHLYGIAASGASDKWSEVFIRVNQSDIIERHKAPTMDLLWSETVTGAASGLSQRPRGVVHFDFIGTSGLGTYGLARDIVNSALVTDIATVLTISTANDTLRTVRRQLLPLA